MPTFHSLQIAPPINWDDFETLCCDLWRNIWGDPNTKKNGRQGQKQDGVDIVGRPGQNQQWGGVQCKGKDNYQDKNLTEKEIRSEVKKAKGFKPTLSEFIIATTGTRDANLDKIAREVTTENLAAGTFSVTVWAWEDIRDRLPDYPEVLKKHFPDYQPTSASKVDADEIKQATHKILEQQKRDRGSITGSLEIIEAKVTSLLDISSDVTTEHQAELDHSRELLNRNEPKQALVYLEKLKGRIWYNSKPIVKFRLLTNIGASHLRLGDESSAARFFLEAVQYNPEDEKAILNSALAHLLQGTIQEARLGASRVLSMNPGNGMAYVILLQTYENEGIEFEDLVRKVPEGNRSLGDVAHALGRIARKKGNLEEASKWFEISVKQDDATTSDVKGILGELLVEQCLKERDAIFSNQVSDLSRERLSRAIQLLSEAWGSVRHTDLRDLRHGWLAQRSVAKKMIGDVAGAIADMDAALELSPSNQVYLRHRAIYAYEKEDSVTAVNFLRRIPDSQRAPEVTYLLAAFLGSQGKRAEAIRIARELAESNPLPPLDEDATQLLIKLYIDENDIQEAKNTVAAMRAQDPTNVLTLVVAAQLSRSESDVDGALSYLSEAQKYVTDQTPFRHVQGLADELYELDQFTDAAQLYKKIADIGLNSPLTRQLLRCYYRSGETGPALEICRGLREKYGPLKDIAEMESVAYEEIGDLANAHKVTEEYLVNFPGDAGMTLRKAVIDFRSGNTEELDCLLADGIDHSGLPLVPCIQLAQLHNIRGNDRTAIDIMYETRRRLFNESEAHLKYVGLFLNRSHKEETWLDTEKAAVDSAVCIEDSSGGKEWYIIDDREDADIGRKEITASHPLAKEMLGKKVGDQIVLKESQISRETGTIVELQSKYVYAFQDSLSNFETRFPNASGLIGVRMQPSEGEHLTKDDLQPVLNVVSKHHENVLKAVQLYKEGRVTVGAIASALNRDILSVLYGITSNPDVGLRCCFGNEIERADASNLLKVKKPKLIVDIISLWTIYKLEVGVSIVDAFGKLGIAQSTIDYLHDRIHEMKGLQSGGFLTMWKDEGSGGFVRNETNEGEVCDSLKEIETLLQWTRDNCIVLPCHSALLMNRTEKERLDKLFGRCFIDTVLIANEPAHSLFSDDERLRSFAKTMLNVDGVWTQVVLAHCVDHGFLEKARFDAATVKLASAHYVYTSVNAETLVEAARQSDWKVEYPFSTVVGILSRQSGDTQSALRVATEFLFGLWIQPILPYQRDNITLVLLDSITRGRERISVLSLFAEYVKIRFAVFPLAEMQVLATIEAWKRLHVL